jgi:hypothetical protein
MKRFVPVDTYRIKKEERRGCFLGYLFLLKYLSASLAG